jgi:ribonuclease P protein component
MKDLGFPRSRRLTTQYEFRKLYQTGRRASNEYLTIYTCPVEGRKGKVGVVASKRLGKAIRRNRIRRALKEIVRTSQHSIIEKTDLVVIAKPRALTLPYDELAQNLFQLLRKNGAFQCG